MLGGGRLSAIGRAGRRKKERMRRPPLSFGRGGEKKPSNSHASCLEGKKRRRWRPTAGYHVRGRREKRGRPALLKKEKTFRKKVKTSFPGEETNVVSMVNTESWRSFTLVGKGGSAIAAMIHGRHRERKEIDSVPFSWGKKLHQGHIAKIPWTRTQKGDTERHDV